MDIRGIYTRVRMECEESGFSKQGWLAAWPCDLTESRVSAARRSEERRVGKECC